MDPRDTPCGTEIRMIAYASHPDACTFVSGMTALLWPLVRYSTWSAVVVTTIVKTKRQFLAALQAPAAVTLVSAHGATKNDLSPRIGDGTDENRIRLPELGEPNFKGFGARAGMIWDACYAGRPGFRKEFARLSRPGVAHVGPFCEIEYHDSVHMATTIIGELLAPGSPPVTPTAFSTAADRAAKAAKIELRHGFPDREKPS
jgi:hypothetical protein